VKEARFTIESIRASLLRKQDLPIEDTDLLYEVGLVLTVLDALVDRIEAAETIEANALARLNDRINTIEARRVCPGCPIV